MSDGVGYKKGQQQRRKFQELLREMDDGMTWSLTHKVRRHDVQDRDVIDLRQVLLHLGFRHLRRYKEGRLGGCLLCINCTHQTPTPTADAHA
jgi:hypothetical protein